MRYQTVLFDLDGTLLDHLTAIHRSYAHTLPQLGLPAPTRDEVRRAIGGGLEHAMRRFVCEPDLARALTIYRAHWDRTMLEGAVLLPGARESRSPGCMRRAVPWRSSPTSTARPRAPSAGIWASPRSSGG